jgi:hypothetical protein
MTTSALPPRRRSYSLPLPDLKRRLTPELNTRRKTVRPPNRFLGGPPLRAA